MLTLLLSPFNLLFFIIIAGFAIGKLQVKQISLGIAGILFVSILVGFLMNQLIPEKNAEIISNAQSTMKTFSKLGTSLFVSVIGLQTGFSIKSNAKGSLIAFAIGSLMSTSATVVMLLISVLDKTISYPTFLGVLCGALTSTPGLSSVCDLIPIGTEDAVWGYGCSYLFGVILVVFFSQILSPGPVENKTQAKAPRDSKSKASPELMLICTAALFGNFLGSIKIASLNISLGTTAATLIVAFVVGYAVKKIFASNLISPQCLNVYRTLGLTLFFAGTGFSAGTQVVAFHIKTLLYGALVTLVAILCGWLFCKVFRLPNANKGFIIAGGMTSSPAYGSIAAKATEHSINCFSFAYFGGLISLIIAVQIIAR